NAGSGRATLRQSSPGVLINLGGADAAATLGLTAAELNSVTAAVLEVGSVTSGNMSVAAAIPPPRAPVLALTTRGTPTQTAGSTITIPNLAIRATNAVTLTQNNDVTTGALAASVTTGGQTFSFTDVNSLTIGSVDGLAGITTEDAAITVTTTGNLTVNNNVNAKSGTVTLTAQGANSTLTNNATISNLGGNTITLQADRMAIGVGTVTAGGSGR